MCWTCEFGDHSQTRICTNFSIAKKQTAQTTDLKMQIIYYDIFFLLWFFFVFFSYFVPLQYEEQNHLMPHSLRKIPSWYQTGSFRYNLRFFVGALPSLLLITTVSGKMYANINPTNKH